GERRGVPVGRRPAAPAVDGPRHQPPPGSRRPRLRAGAPRHVPGRAPGARHGLHDRAGPLLQGRRSAGARGVPRDRRPHRGRRPRDARRGREPVRGLPPHPRRGRGLGPAAGTGADRLMGASAAGATGPFREPFGRLVPGGSVVSVPGVRVGAAQATTEGWLTGTTVLLPPAGTVAGVDVAGGGPAGHETDVLAPGTHSPGADAI